MNILWGITGAGHQLKESAEAIRKLAGKHRITAAYSGAGYEVAAMYGLRDEIEGIVHETFRDEDQGYSSPLVGRLAGKEYDLLVVSPCTANTVAKIAAGIADNLITNLVAQAMKSKTPVYVVPTDSEKTHDTTLPAEIDNKKCKRCEACPPQDNCPEEAIYRDPRLRIDMLMCSGCRLCASECPHGAVSFGRAARIHMRDLDLENTKKIGKMEGIKTFLHPSEIPL
jgi:dihydromethanopterin reductase (acceptor)